MTFKIMPHGRLQEWIAEEKDYFAAEGLDYAFVPEGDYGITSGSRDSSGQIRTGAYETFDAGRGGANISCACHWATNEAATRHAGKLVTTAYSVTPGAIMVAPESEIRRPEDLADVQVGVGYHSGSHFATVQALEEVLPTNRIQLSWRVRQTSAWTRCWIGVCRRRRSGASPCMLRSRLASARSSMPRS